MYAGSDKVASRRITSCPEAHRPRNPAYYSRQERRSLPQPRSSLLTSFDVSRTRLLYSGSSGARSSGIGSPPAARELSSDSKASGMLSELADELSR